jgi:hypothetical protein
MAVSRFSSVVLIRMCGNESIVVGVDIGNLIALDTGALRKERPAQTSSDEAATSHAAAQMRRRKSRLFENYEVPGARRYGAALGLEACGVSSLGRKSQMEGHFAGHDRYMGSRRGFVNKNHHSTAIAHQKQAMA